MAAPAITHLLPTPSTANPAGGKNTEAQADGDGFSSVLQQKIMAERRPHEARPATESARQSPSPQKQTPNDTPADATAPLPVEALATPSSPLEGILPWLNGVAAQTPPEDEQGLISLEAKLPESLVEPDTTLAGISVPAGLLLAAEASGAHSNTGETKSQPAFMRPLIHQGTGPAETGTVATGATSTADEAANLASLKGSDTTTLAAQTAISDNNGSAPAFAQALTHAAEHRKETVASESQPATLRSPVASSEWAAELGDRLVWMSNRLESRAEMILTPPQLGKIEISLHVTGEQASVSFVSANPQVRDALEGAINRLREVLAENGISLGQANVGAESSGQQFAQPRQSLASGNEETAPPAITSLPWQQKGNGMVDIFA